MARLETRVNRKDAEFKQRSAHHRRLAGNEVDVRGIGLMGHLEYVVQVHAQLPPVRVGSTRSLAGIAYRPPTQTIVVISSRL